MQMGGSLGAATRHLAADPTFWFIGLRVPVAPHPLASPPNA